MTRGVCFVLLSVLSLVESTRQSAYAKMADVEEHTAESRSVPKVIYDALREAGALVQTHLDTLQEANRLAEQKKADSTAKIDEKMKVMKDMQAKTDHIAAKAKATRDLMIKVEKAAAEHSKAGDDHKTSMTKFGKISDDVEALARKITMKEQALTQIVSTYKRQIAEMKAQMDEMMKDKEKAENEMKDLKTQAVSAGKFKTDVQQEQAKTEKEMQTAQQELQAIRRALETAVSAATVAEAQEAMAVNEAREANGRMRVAKTTKQLLMAVRADVRKYYGSIDDLEGALEAQDVESGKTMSKTMLEKYNLMISSFLNLRAYDAEVYSKVTPAIKEIKDNAFAQIRFICDMIGLKSKSEDGHCFSDLWKTLGMTKLEIPSD
mmetsp:Transcript_30070/g.48517  ORF Transcript_30070/g.48517 Transcript_30070/m.48517 type:complete len:378 (-) Transcript_30070:92-1225(-)